MSTNSETYVLFELAGSTYGLPSRIVQHIDMVEHVTAVPNVHPAIDGVIFSRGEVIPALNLRTRFGLPTQERSLRTRLICVSHNNRKIGLVVDTAREFREIPSEKIRPIDETLIRAEGNYLRGVAQLGERLILLPEIETVLNVDETLTFVPPETLNA